MEAVGRGPTRYGLVVVVGWVGLMKFTTYEAEGIRPFTTLSFLVTAPGAWEPSLGGFHALSAVPRQFVINDLALLGISLWTLGEAWQVPEQRG